MQQTFGLKRFMVTHLGAAALSVGILLSTALGVTALTATGNLPRVYDDTAEVTAQKSLAHRGAQQAALIEAKQARLEDDELHASQTTAQSVAGQRQLRMDRSDFLAWRRLVAPVDATTAPATAASTRQFVDRRDRTDAIAALRATLRIDMTPEAPEDANNESWTLQDDLTPARTWQ
jgi:hypothetical protein